MEEGGGRERGRERRCEKRVGGQYAKRSVEWTKRTAREGGTFVKQLYQVMLRVEHSLVEGLSARTEQKMDATVTSTDATVPNTDDATAVSNTGATAVSNTGATVD